MRIHELLKENYGWKGNYTEAEAMLLHEMSIVASITIDSGGNFDDAIQAAMKDFYDDILDMGLDPLKVENDLTFERKDDILQFLAKRGRA